MLGYNTTGGKRNEDSIYSLEFPSIIDNEGDNLTTPSWILMSPDSYTCGCINLRFNLTEPVPVVMEIDRRKITEKDIGTYKVIVTMRDDKYELSH